MENQSDLIFCPVQDRHYSFLYGLPSQGSAVLTLCERDTHDPPLIPEEEWPLGIVSLTQLKGVLDRPTTVEVTATKDTQHGAEFSTTDEGVVLKANGLDRDVLITPPDLADFINKLSS